MQDAARDMRIVHTRLLVAALVIGALVLVLLGRLFYLQVVAHEHFVTLSRNNRIAMLPVAPVRGLIFDRNGVVLADNFPVYTLEVVPDQVADLPALLEELAEIVTLAPDDLKRFERLRRERPGFESLTLRQRLSEREAARLAVNRHRLQGAELSARLQRHYPLGPVGAHVVGYVGRINEGELARLDPGKYRGTDHIGKLGAEAAFEDELLGVPGYQQVETNAHGRIVRTLARDPSRTGQHVYLNIDIRLQALAEAAMGARRGAVVALEPATGAILAMASTPSYDTNPFVDGIDADSYAQLRESPDRPLINRALHGRYAPGSTLKPLMALAGLNFGRSPAQTTFCPGWFSLPGTSHRYRCWKKTGHGSMDMHDAVVQSCDVYFYELATRLGIDRIDRFLQGFGLGEPTGIELLGEAGGLLPTPEWKRRVRREPWYTGETVSLGIGQGYLLVTPLQLAHAMAVLANRGHPMRPRLLRGLQNGPDPLEPAPGVPLAPLEIANSTYFDIVAHAMEDVVHSPRGTAQRIGFDAPYRIAGKTGTAQVIGIGQNERYDENAIPERLRDHALFVAYAPVDKPRIAVAVVVENGGHGSSAAAPVARQVMDFYFRTTGMPGAPAS